MGAPPTPLPPLKETSAVSAGGGHGACAPGGRWSRARAAGERPRDTRGVAPRGGEEGRRGCPSLTGATTAPLAPVSPRPRGCVGGCVGGRAAFPGTGREVDFLGGRNRESELGPSPLALAAACPNLGRWQRLRLATRSPEPGPSPGVYSVESHPLRVAPRHLG